MVSLPARPCLFATILSISVSLKWLQQSGNPALHVRQPQQHSTTTVKIIVQQSCSVGVKAKVNLLTVHIAAASYRLC